jgi:hypothetical protein
MASLLALVACTQNTAEAPDAAAGDGGAVMDDGAQAALLAAFDRYQVVGGMNASHGSKGVDDFILALLRNPRLADKVNDIAVECGNALYQSILDQYIAGGDIPLAQVRPVWRNTTQIECGFSTFYEQLVPLVRRINDTLPAGKKLRVLACDPPVDWSKVHSMADLMPFMDRDEHIAAVMEREVLARGRRALVLFGIHHVQHQNRSAVARYEQAVHRNLTFVIADHIGFGNATPSLSADNARLEAQMASWATPTLVTIEGTWLARLDPGYFNEEPAAPGQLGYPGVDGYLYVGSRDSLLREPRSAQAALDRDYIAELEQRANEVGAPPDASRRPASIFQEESHDGAFLYDPGR